MLLETRYTREEFMAVERLIRSNEPEISRIIALANGLGSRQFTEPRHTMDVALPARPQANSNFKLKLRKLGLMRLNEIASRLEIDHSDNRSILADRIDEKLRTLDKNVLSDFFRLRTVDKPADKGFLELAEFILRGQNKSSTD
jgi:hypothetical protein